MRLFAGKAYVEVSLLTFTLPFFLNISTDILIRQKVKEIKSYVVT